MRSASDWMKARAIHLRTYPECRVCGLVDPANHVHHMRYRGKRGTGEKSGDLVTLCLDDHMEFHRALGQRGVTFEAGIEWINAARAAMLVLA